MRTAIIGTGIAGLGAAHFLHRAGDDITCFGAEDHPGGHSHTVEVIEPGTGRALPIDTGFMVFDHDASPQLRRLFDELQAPLKRTDPSFAVKDADNGLEWGGASLNHLFAQRKNLFSPRFVRLFLAVRRFNKEAVSALRDDSSSSAIARETLVDYVRRRGYGEDFWNLYLVPVGGSIWSTPPERMMEFPALSLLRFFHDHGLLALRNRHPWCTVDGGSREYVKRLVAPFADRVRLGCAVTRIIRHGGSGNAGRGGSTPRGVSVLTADGGEHAFDRVVVATHADQALRLLVNPTGDEERLLGAFKYQADTATLHTDTEVMPRSARAWAGRVYQISRDKVGRVIPATHHWMNRLQDVSEREHYFVSVGRPEQIAPAKVVKTIAREYPLFDLGTQAAQAGLPALNAAARGTTETYFAGGYFRHGSHEDAFASAVGVAELLLGRDPWTATQAAGPDASAGIDAGDSS